jgi:cell division protein FtsQ
MSGQSPRSRRDAGGLWDRPQLLNLIADALLVAGAAALTYCAVMSVLALPIFPLKDVVVKSPLGQTTEAQLQYAAHSSLAGNFFTVNLEKVRASFEKLPWVRHAEVRRRWPSTLELTLEEHQPVAYWRRGDEGDTRLINTQGEVFSAATNAALPEFSGPEGSAALLLARYQEFSDTLAPAKRKVVRLALSDRQAWQVKLDDGLTLNLGREQMRRPLNDRLQRFVAVREAAFAGVQSKTGARPMVADLRYPNGFVLRAAQAVAVEKGKS